MDHFISSHCTFQNTDLLFCITYKPWEVDFRLFCTKIEPYFLGALHGMHRSKSHFTIVAIYTLLEANIQARLIRCGHERPSSFTTSTLRCQVGRNLLMNIFFLDQHTKCPRTPASEELKEVDLFHQFRELVLIPQRIRPYRTEMIVFDEDLKETSSHSKH